MNGASAQKPKHLKLLVIIRKLTPYWTEALCCLAESWSAHGSMVVVTGGDGTDELHPWETKPLENIGKAEFVLIPPLSGKWAFGTIWPPRKMWDFICQTQPDLILIHEYSPYVLGSGLLWAKAAGIPCVLTSDVGPEQRTQFPWLQRLAHQWVNWSVDGVLAKTQDAFNQSRLSYKNGLFAPHAISVRFYQVAEQARFHRAKWKPHRIIQVGSLIHRKGVDLLLKAFLQARTTRPDLLLTLVGAGNHAATRQQVEQMGLSGAVQILDFMQPADLARLYGEHDLFVLASRFDSYGVVVHEAAAAGLPLVISCHAGASAALVEQNVNGHRIDPEDTTTFSEAILDCLDIRQHTAYRAASRRIAEKYDVKMVANRTANWLKDTASQVKTRPWPASIPPKRLRGLIAWLRDGLKGMLRRHEQLLMPDAFNCLKREIVFLNRHIPQYRENLFRKIAEWKSVRLIHSGLSLGNLPQVEGVESCSVPFLRWKRSGRPKIIWLHALPDLWLTRPRLICTEHSLSLLSTWSLFLLRPTMGFKLVFWTHGLQSYGWKHRHLTLDDRLRLWWLKWADAVIFYSQDRKKDVEELTGPSRSFFVAPNALDVHEIEDVYQTLAEEGRATVRKRLGLQEPTFVHVGRLVPEKEPLGLIRFFQALNSPNYRLEIIGGGELELPLKQAFAAFGSRVRFHGPIFDRARIMEWLFAADMMVSTGYLGLNVVDSLLAGCPVATLRNHALIKRHSPEITYLHEGFNVVWANDLDDLSRQSNAWIKNPATTADSYRLGIRNRLIQECSLESQFEGFRKAFSHALGETTSTTTDSVL